MIAPSLTERIEAISEPFLQKMGVELVDLHIHQARMQTNVQLLVDKPAGGISLAECAQLNRDIGQAIEAQSLIEHQYMLEVSSPGLDRPLKTKKDFARALGRPLHFFLTEPVEGRIEYIGTLKMVEEISLTVELQGREVFIPLEKINRAKQII